MFEYRVAADAGVSFSVTAANEEDAIKKAWEIIDEHVNGLNVSTWDEDGEDALNMRVYFKSQEGEGMVTIEDCRPFGEESAPFG